jgi:RNA polymerase sigma-70 factor (ECF subfamily)
MTSSTSPVPPDDRTREFLRLLGEHEQRLGAFIYSLSPNWADAQDIAQELRLRLWDQFAEYDPTKDFGVWARTIARYLVLAHREHQSRRRHNSLSTESIEAVADQFDSQSDHLEARRRALESCLEALADHTRALVMRVYAGGETLHQVAEATGKTYAATRKAVLRIRGALGRCIEQTLKEDA